MTFANHFLIMACIVLLSMLSGNAGEPKPLHLSSLKLRGGAGPIDPDTICKINTCLSGAQGLWMQLGPRDSNELMYGVDPKDNTLLVQVFAELAGDSVVSLFLMPFLMQIMNTSFRAAYAASNALFAYKSLEYTLSGKCVTAGYKSRSGPFTTFLVRLACAIVVLKDFGIADTVVKSSIAYWGLVGAAIVLVPEAAGKAFGLDADLSETAVILARATGYALLGTSIFQGAIVFYDQPVRKALGFAVLANACWYAQSLWGGSAKNNGLNVKLLMTQLIFHSVTAAAMVI